MTLIELLVAITIAAIAASLAMPTMSRLLAHWHTYQATRLIVGHLSLARSTAIKSTQRVVMCNSLDGANCAGPDQTSWAIGWIVFKDDNANNVRDTNETLLANIGERQGIVSMASSNNVRRYVFMPNGLMSSGMGSLVIEPYQGESVTVVVSRVGRVRLAKPQK